MGYFSNGTEGELYFEHYCERCIHNGAGNGPMCPVWNLHLWRGYEECNNDKSMLHVLIPRDKDHENLQCTMFVDAGYLSPLAREKYFAERDKALVEDAGRQTTS